MVEENGSLRGVEKVGEMTQWKDVVMVGKRRSMGGGDWKSNVLSLS